LQPARRTGDDAGPKDAGALQPSSDGSSGAWQVSGYIAASDGVLVKLRRNVAQGGRIPDEDGFQWIGPIAQRTVFTRPEWQALAGQPLGEIGQGDDVDVVPLGLEAVPSAVAIVAHQPDSQVQPAAAAVHPLVLVQVECRICATDKPRASLAACRTSGCDGAMCRDCLSKMSLGDRKWYCDSTTCICMFYRCPFCNQTNRARLGQLGRRQLMRLLLQCKNRCNNSHAD
jgi:hypothetical protein